jgi:L-alanine-DL-glutamate epimerase-like enolase superfamily enzyme
VAPVGAARRERADDVPWREELTTAVPDLQDGELVVRDGPGWGCDVREDVLREHARSR